MEKTTGYRLRCDTAKRDVAGLIRRTDACLSIQVFKGGSVKVSSGLDSIAHVVEADLVAFNGVVHALDRLL